jgi:uncharacterized protein
MTKRYEHIDVVRGIAIFGLIWSNLNAGMYTGEATTADAVAQWASTVFSAGKFFTLFSLLFGVTLAMQLERGAASSQPFATRWLRRMLVLYAIGWMHAMLFWPGDILREYAISGVVLLLFSRLSNRVVIVAALACLTVASTRDSLSVHVTRMTGGDVQAVRASEEPTAELTAKRRAAGAAMRDGSYLDVVRTRIAVAPGNQGARTSAPAGPLNWISPWYLGLFLIGLVLGRRHIPQEPAQHRRALLYMFVLGATTGLGLNVYLASSPAWLANHPLYWPMAIAARLTLGLGYLGGALLLLQSATWASRLTWLAPVGRLGLTNYIAQTAFITFIRAGYGLGLQPVLGWAECLLLAVAFYGTQVVFSNWWVRRFETGPVERLWRRLAYGARNSPLPATAASA